MSLPIRNSRIKLTQGQIFWREVGIGVPIVFLHGSWSDSSEWTAVIESLGHTYQCLAPDLLGFGDSDRPNIHYSIEGQVETLAEFLDAVNLRTVYLVGHSIGGWLAASYALRYPERVKGLVLLGAEGVKPTGMGDRWTAARLLAAHPPLVFWFLRLFFPIARLLGKDVWVTRWLALRQQFRRSPAACQLLFRRRQAEIQSELLHDRLSWLKVPVFVLQGEFDRSINTLLNQTYATAPLGKLCLIPNAKEDLLTFAPEQVAEEVAAIVGHRVTVS